MIWVLYILGPINLSTRVKLISPGVTAPGTLSVTSSEFYFEVEEDDAAFKKLDCKVSFKLGHFYNSCCWVFMSLAKSGMLGIN